MHLEEIVMVVRSSVVTGTEYISSSLNASKRPTLTGCTRRGDSNQEQADQMPNPSKPDCQVSGKRKKLEQISNNALFWEKPKL